jgi:hypothetical protein
MATRKQTTRMLKATCPKCGYAVRTTRRWLELGAPLCPSGDRMVTVRPEYGSERPPVALESSPMLTKVI